MNSFLIKFERIIQHILNLLLLSVILYITGNKEFITQFPLQFIILIINFIVTELAMQVVNSSTTKE